MASIRGRERARAGESERERARAGEHQKANTKNEMKMTPTKKSKTALLDFLAFDLWPRFLSVDA